MSNTQDESAGGAQPQNDGAARDGDIIAATYEEPAQASLLPGPASATPAPVSNLIMVPIAAIKVGPRLRSVRKDHVAELKTSIALLGLQQPISVAKSDTGSDPEAPEKAFLLVAGRHRLEACESLGHSEVPAIVVTLGDEQRRLWEIDENLYRLALTVLEQGEHLVERKGIFERLHPGAAHGGDRRSDKFKRQTSPLGSFAGDTAAKTGIAPRTIRLSMARANGIDLAVRGRIRGNPKIADNGSELDALASLTSPDQNRAVQLIEDETYKSIKEAKRMMARGPAQNINQNGNDDAEGPDTEVPMERLAAADSNPGGQDLIREIRKIIDTLDTCTRANLVNYLSKLGNTTAKKIANCLI
jgi:ParB family transcriptional regulator, chromosome partitioning protein